MVDGPYWVILLMYGSHDMRHTGFRRLTVVNGTPESGRHSSNIVYSAPSQYILYRDLFIHI